MPITTLEPVIELSDFMQGWVPKAEEVGVPPNAVLDAENVMVDTVTGSVVTRKGFKRTFDTAALNGYRLYSISPYTDSNGADYLMCVFSNDTSSANNIQIWSYLLSGGIFARRDTVGRTWASSNGRHWGTTIDNVFYGGGEGDAFYSWDPTRGTPWNAAPSTAVYPTWVEQGTDPGANRARDYAFKKGEAVTLAGKAYQARKSIIYDDWSDTGLEDGKYKLGDRVSTEYSIIASGTSGAYRRSWECINKHTPKPANKPGTGSGNWKRVRLAKPTDSAGKLNANHWNRVPDPPKSRIAVWHGSRLFTVDNVRKQVLLYSRAAKVADRDNIGEDVIGEPGNPTWDPHDWRTGGAEGAGFQPFETDKGDDIAALVSFGYYLLVFKRHSTHVIAGVNPDTWTVRQLSNTGCIYSKAAAELGGWVYFISDRGFFRTNGTEVKAVPGSEKVDAWLRAAINWGSEPKDVELWAYDGYLWMTLPTEKSQLNDKVLVYEPLTTSFWPLDLKIQTSAITKRNGRDQLFFSAVNHTAQAVYATFRWLGTPHLSTSEKNLNSVITNNFIPNPTNAPPPTEMWEGPVGWSVFDSSKTIVVGTKSARHGKYGIEIQNLRNWDSTAGPRQGYEGMYTTLTVTAGTYVMQFVARRKNWVNNPTKTPDVKFTAAADTIPAGVPFDSTGTEYLGNGWHKIWRVFTTSAVPVRYGILVGSGATVSIDKIILTVASSGPVKYFDGDGGEGELSTVVGGERPYMFQYAHEDAVDADKNWTDDTAQNTYSGTSISWFLRTAWLVFGVLQEERRIRRLWALVRANNAFIGLRTFRNFIGSQTGSYAASVSPDQGVVYHEGVLPDDAHALQIEVEGSRSPAALLGVAADTEPRRVRFGRR